MCCEKHGKALYLLINSFFYLLKRSPNQLSNLESISVAKHDDYIVVLSKHKFGFRIQKAVS